MSNKRRRRSFKAKKRQESRRLERRRLEALAVSVHPNGVHRNGTAHTPPQTMAPFEARGREFGGYSVPVNPGHRDLAPVQIVQERPAGTSSRFSTRVLDEVAGQCQVRQKGQSARPGSVGTAIRRPNWYKEGPLVDPEPQTECVRGYLGSASVAEAGGAPFEAAFG